MKTVAILFGLLAIISVAYTLPTKEQDDDGGDVKTFMEDLMKGVVVQMQEEEDQQSSAELQSAMRDLLVEVQDDDEDRDMSALLQDESDETKARKEDDDDDDILALLQGEEEDNGGDGAEVQDDVETQGWFGKVFKGIRRFGGRVNKVCKKVNKYTRYLKCLPRMQAEMQKADDGDDELAKELIKRMANAQEDDADAQFFRRIFKRARKVWRRGRRYFKKIRSGVGRIYRGYKNIRNCVRRYRG